MSVTVVISPLEMSCEVMPSGTVVVVIMKIGSLVVVASSVSAVAVDSSEGAIGKTVSVITVEMSCVVVIAREVSDTVGSGVVVMSKGVSVVAVDSCAMVVARAVSDTKGS